MRLRLKRLNSRHQRLAVAVATFVSVLYTLLLVLMAYIALSRPSPLALWFLIPFIFLCVLFWGHLIGLVVTVPNVPGRCPGCGYLLIGLPERRCPECGRPFTFKEVRRTP